MQRILFWVGLVGALALLFVYRDTELAQVLFKIAGALVVIWAIYGLSVLAKRHPVRD